MHDILVVYDDSAKPRAEIRDIIGDKTFGEVILQRKTLKRRFREALEPFDFIKGPYVLEDASQAWGLMEAAAAAPGVPVLHVYSDAVIVDMDAMAILLEKTRYAKLNARAGGGLALVFKDTADYAAFLERSAGNTKKLPEGMEFEALQSTALGSIGDAGGFVRHLTGGFDARYFNTLTGDAYVVTKKSKNKEKIKREYTYYHLLPERMKMWFVLPFDYGEDAEYAWYSMKRYHVTDLAIKWVNGSVNLPEFRRVLEMAFYFINRRERKAVSEGEYRAAEQALYIGKVKRRIEELKAAEVYPAVRDFIARGTRFDSIDGIFAEYERLFALLHKKVKFAPAAVIGHGDLCFANMLYYNETSTMKFIDVKGALTEDEMWLDPYYDLAKLSHSICGNYDLFNSDLYEISLSAELDFKLETDFDNSAYVAVFKEFLEQNGYDYAAVRLFEASLFLSMLPLHADVPKKVFGFLLNAANILDEVEACLKK